jgi:UDP-N-acetyl-D-galactosamine dehydrogenase
LVHKAKQTVKKILAEGKHLSESHVLVMGFTFKENVADIRNSKVADIIRELQSYQVKVDVVDPYADPEEMMKEYQIALKPAINGKYDAIIVAVAHKEYRAMKEENFKAISVDKGLLVDVKGLYLHQIKEMDYWSL